LDAGVGGEEIVRDKQQQRLPRIAPSETFRPTRSFTSGQQQQYLPALVSARDGRAPTVCGIGAGGVWVWAECVQWRSANKYGFLRGNQNSQAIMYDYRVNHVC
jgi:hypothetical protein